MGKAGAEMRNIVGEFEYKPKCDFPVVYERPHWAHTFGKAKASKVELQIKICHDHFNGHYGYKRENTTFIITLARDREKPEKISIIK